MAEMTLNNNTKTVSIITQQQLEASYSKNNDLKSLSVEGYEITPEFSSSVTEYSVVVPENTKEVKINGAVSDYRSSLNGIGFPILIS